MLPLNPPADTLLVRAAEARAEGNCWKVVAELVKRSEETVRKWPVRYPDRWETALRAAVRRTVDDAAAEGTLVLRNLVRVGEDDEVRRKAAWHLIYQRLEVLKLEAQAAALAGPPPPSEAQIIADFVNAHTPEQLAALATNVAVGVLKDQAPQRLAELVAAAGA